MVESGVCEPSRLLHILGMITAGRPLYNSDRAYLDRIASRLADKESALRRENRRIRRVLGGAGQGMGAAGQGMGAAGHPAAAPAPAPGPPPAPVIDAAAPAAARQGAPLSPSGRRAFRPPPPRDAPSPGAPTPRPAPGAPNAGQKSSGGLLPGAPPPRPAPAAPGSAPSPARPRGALIDDASLDAILERRDRQRRSGARERAAEAVAAPQSSRPSQSSSPREARPAGALRAGPDSPPRGKIAGRLRGMVAGRR